MSMAYLAATRSRDPSSKVGAVIVGPDKHIRASGYNGIPKGVEYEDTMFECPIKYWWMEHAEKNAIYAAARRGQSLENCTIYCPFTTCVDCARGIIQSGISEVVTNSKQQPFASSTPEMREFVAKLYSLAGVKARTIELDPTRWTDLG